MRDKWQIKEVALTDIIETEVNANRMSDYEFNRLVENIRTSGMSSMIACYEDENGKHHIISGNHRYRACKHIGYTSLNILTTPQENLTRDEIIALQLSHNSLHGSDDKAILRDLLEEIESIDYRIFAHIEMDDLPTGDTFTASIVPMSEHYNVSLVLYRQDIRNIETLLELEADAKETNDIVIMVNGDQVEDAFLDAMSKARRNYDIKSSSIAFSKILEAAMIEMGRHDPATDD